MNRFRIALAASVLLMPVASCGVDTSDDDRVIIGGNEPYDEAGIDAWGESFETLESGKSDQPGCSGVIVPDSSGFGGRIALTFDDGPEPRPTNIVLDVLAAHEIKATFFINGKRVDSQADHDTLRRITSEGHILANHSHNHENLGTMVDLARVEREVDRTHQIIEDAGVSPVYFRFPFGSSTCDTADLVRSFGYRVAGWHNDSADWCFASSTGGVGYCDPRTFRWVPDSLRDDMVALVLEQAHQKNGGILLFHDVHMNTANHIDEIISTLKNEGFTFVNLDDVSTFPLLNNDDLGDLPWTGTVCQEDVECEFGDGSRCLNYEAGGMSAGFCTTACEGFCDDFPGRAPTFCVSVDGGESGTCLSKPSAANSNCAELVGTSVQTKARFVGGSTAPASTSPVCFPDSLQ